mgnify:CR=1 FL=1
MTAARTFVDTDILIGVARRAPRALDFWRRADARSVLTCSVISLFELLAGQRPFEYEEEEGERREVRSEDVNDYLRAAAGVDVTAKDLRTWSATVLVALCPAMLPG